MDGALKNSRVAMGAQYGSVEAPRHQHDVKEETPASRLTNSKLLLAVGATTMIVAGFVATSTTQAPTVQLEKSDISNVAINAPTTVHVVESSYLKGKSSLFHKSSTIKVSKSKKKPSSVIYVDDKQVFQEVLGFGGAFTEASALNLLKLPLDKQEEILHLYFDKKTGAGYTIGRVPMGSSDYSPKSYSFDEVVGDVKLEKFDTNVTHDTETMIPLIRRALKLRPDIRLFLSPWSPPAWMKLPNSHGEYSMTGSAWPNGLNSKYQEAWALYFSKFITAYKNHGVNFWGLTPQNEPMFAAPWDACLYTADFEASFVGDYLGPVIQRDHPGVKILVFDHNRDYVDKWAQAAYTKASKYVDGVAFHWYNNDGRELDGALYYNHLNDTHHLDTSKLLLATEACNCPGVATGNDAWFRAQRYGHDIISDFNNYANGWVDWNLVLDHTGGPNHLNNKCDAPVILNPEGTDYTLQPLYYFIKHFSAFVPPGSRRIATDVQVKYTKPGQHNLFTKYPAAAHFCDGSARQVISRTSDNKLQVHDSDYCIDVVHETFGDKIELVKCIYTSNTNDFTADGQIKLGGKCLSVAHGSLANGATITLDACNGASYQQWTVSASVVTNHANDFCLTAGYAFAQAVAFKTPSNRTVVVVQNENTEDAKFTLNTGDGVVDTVVPQGAIRTFYWDP
ncbi:unnamed protein product [Aphanomyces euteiches]